MILFLHSKHISTRTILANGNTLAHLYSLHSHRPPIGRCFCCKKKCILRYIWMIVVIFYSALNTLCKIPLISLGDPASEYLLAISIISLSSTSLGVPSSFHSVYHKRNIAWSIGSMTSYLNVCA